MNPSMVLTLAAGLLLLLTGLTSGRPTTTDDPRAPEATEGTPPTDV
jgi:hypothetical protein